MFQYYKDLNENLVLTEKTRELKGTRGNLTFATTHTHTHTNTHTHTHTHTQRHRHTVNVIEP